MVDTVREGTDTTATLTVGGGSVSGTIDQNGMDGANAAIDKDWYAVTLTAGRTYTFSGSATTSGDTLDAIAISLYNSGSTLVRSFVEGGTPSFAFTVPAGAGGTYYLAVSAGGTGAFEDKTGAFSVNVVDSTPVGTTDTVREGTDTGSSLTVGGGSVSGTIDQNGMDGANTAIDKDWYAVTLTAGRTYTFSGSATTSGDTLDAIAIRLYNSSSTVVSSTDDAALPSITFTVPSGAGGTYYLAASAGGSSTPVAWQDKTGAFSVSVNETGSVLEQFLAAAGNSDRPNLNAIADFSRDIGLFVVEQVSEADYRSAIRNLSLDPKVYLYDSNNGNIYRYTVNSARIADEFGQAIALRTLAKALGWIGLAPDALELGTAMIRVGDSPDGFDNFIDATAGFLTVLAGVGLAALAAPFVGTVAGGIIVGAGIIGAFSLAADVLEDSQAASSFVNMVLDNLPGSGFIPWSDPLYDPFRTANSTPPMTVLAQPSQETHTLTEAAPIVWGLAPNLSGDTLLNFGTGDAFVVSGSTVPRADMSITSGSAIIRLMDSTTGTYLTPVTLPGDFSNGEFMAVAANGNTIVRFVEFLPDLRDGATVLNPNLLGIQNPEFFQGNGERDLAVRVVAQPNAAGDSTDAFGVFWIDALGNISNVQFINPGIGAIIDAPLVLDTLPQGMTLGLFAADGGADLARTLTSADTLRG